MSVHLLLLLLLLPLVRSEHLTVGKRFTLVFPENIAYYHPSSADNKVVITALHDGTTVSLLHSDTQIDSRDLESGQIKEINIDSELELELDKSNFSTNVLNIRSNQDIAAEILSHRNNSLQTALLLPTDQLGLEYKVPPIPETQLELNGISGTIAVTERNPFKLILVNNPESSNTITVQGSSVQLEPNQLVQFWVTPDMVDSLVTGTEAFLALLAHPCNIQFDCICGALYTPLQPHSNTGLTFIVPPVFSEGSQSKTYLLKPSEVNAVEFTSGSDGTYMENGPVVLQKPGLLMNLIPEEEFGSCFSIYTVADAEENWAVIVAPEESTDDVMIGSSSAGGSWEPIPGSNGYKYSRFQLNNAKTIFWHKSGLMAVYFLGKKFQDREAWFGNPAARLSQDPDHRGCVLEPEVIMLYNNSGTWQESIKACRSQDLDLISLSDPILQTQIYNWTLSHNQNLTELWMGLRRSSYSELWYWISEDPLSHEDWSHGSPGGPDDGACARISLMDSENPGWSHHGCCERAKAVCYKPPKLLTI